jgi:hypothetical protein
MEIVNRRCLMWRAVLCLLVSCPFVMPLPVHAQAAERQVRQGDRVWVTAPTIHGEFLVSALTNDTLVLHGSSPSDAPIRLSLNSISRLEIGHTRSRGAGVLRRAGTGLLVGVASGALLGIVQGDDTSEAFIQNTRGEKVLLYGGSLGLAGAVIGGLAGFFDPGEQWERVDLTERLGFSWGSNGAQLTYAYRF